MHNPYGRPNSERNHRRGAQDLMDYQPSAGESSSSLPRGRASGIRWPPSWPTTLSFASQHRAGAAPIGIPTARQLSALPDGPCPALLVMISTTS